jgi:septal ring factor EnvC (AmiA/AmiB activator)
MRVGLLLVALMLAAPCMASRAETNDKPTTPHRHHAHSHSVSTRQRVARHQIEVQHLQQDVSKQEARSQQATERLQQQDQAIADLQKQLQQARSSQPAEHH